MREIVKINACAEGYYSGQTYNESIYIYKDTYEKLNKPIELYIYELDGKHSEVESDIIITNILTEEDLLKAVNADEGDDGDSLYWRVLDNEGVNSDEVKLEIDEIQEIIGSLDYDVSKTVTLKKSQLPLLDEFLEKLQNT